MFSNITKREKTLGIITVGILIAALIYNFIIEPLAQRWSDLEKEIREKEAILRKHSRVLRNKNIIEKMHSEFTEYFEAEKLTPEEENAKALSSIEKLARNARVRITNIKPLAARDFDAYAKYTFRVTTESRIGELTKFIYEMKSSQQLLKVERMVLRAKEREPDTIKAILHISEISVF